MFKTTVKYTNYNGLPITEDCYFNISKAELIEMETGVTGGLSEMLKDISATQDVSRVIPIFKQFLTMSYGKKMPDGRFRKNKEILEDFTSSEAFSELFVKMVQNPDFAYELVIGAAPDIKSMSLPTTPELMSEA